MEYPFQLIDFLSGKIGMMEPSRPESGVLESSGLNKTQDVQVINLEEGVG
jgi:hypothetical protein